MAIATPPTAKLLTYEDYLAEETVYRRYDIIEGMRVFMSAPTWQHQRIQSNILLLLRVYEAQSGRGFCVGAPIDVLIRRQPRLQTRQPDVLFIAHPTLARGGGIPATGPLTVGPELIVEIVSSSDRENVLAAKLDDYCDVGVQEAWIVYPDTRAVTVQRLTPAGPVPVADHPENAAFTSLVFPDLAVTVADFFRP
jgi:Uma2 family endonuclease